MREAPHRHGGQAFESARRCGAIFGAGAGTVWDRVDLGDHVIAEQARGEQRRQARPLFPDVEPIGARAAEPEQSDGLQVDREQTQRPLALGTARRDVTDPRQRGVGPAGYEVDVEPGAREAGGHFDRMRPRRIGQRNVDVADHHETRLVDRVRPRRRVG